MILTMETRECALMTIRLGFILLLPYLDNRVIDENHISLSFEVRS